MRLLGIVGNKLCILDWIECCFENVCIILYKLLSIDWVWIWFERFKEWSLFDDYDGNRLGDLGVCEGDVRVFKNVLVFNFFEFFICCEGMSFFFVI